MRSQAPTHAGAPAVPSVVDTLSAGFNLVNRAPWLLAIPALVDLLLWLGPRLSIAAIAEGALGRAAAFANQLGRMADAASGEQVEQLRSQIELLRLVSREFNLLYLLAFRGFTPHSAVPPPRGGLAGDVAVASGGEMLALTLVLSIVGVLLAVLWLWQIAHRVRGGTLAVRNVPRYWLAMLGFYVLVAVAGVAISVPLSVLAALAQVAVPAFGSFLLLFVLVALNLLFFWALIYLRFFAEAIFVSDAGPIRAATSSLRVVSTNFWSTLGFLIITWVIIQGLDVIWGQLAQAPVGLAVAIFGNGYVESGLAAASMLFYRDRFARLST